MPGVNKINDLYKSEAGEDFANKELVPVVKRFLKKKTSAKILEIGCGYGRNLTALANLPGVEISGCDISKKELAKANEKLRLRKIENVQTVLQTELARLPFDDDQFDFIILWQVLEHVLEKKDKQHLLDEAVRVLKTGGHILIETPNFFFPIDYHDSGLPLVHWLLCDKYRQKLTTLIRHEEFPASQYTNIYQIRSFLKKSSRVNSFVQETAIFFENRYSDIFNHLSGARILSKKIFFMLYSPVYFFLNLIGIKGDLFTPSLRAVFKIKK